MIKIILCKIKWKLKLLFHDDEKRATTINIDIAKKCGVNVGEKCRFFSLNFSTEPYLISIGNHVTITNNVQFITHDGGVWVFRDEYPEIELFGKIVVGNNVFIGLNSIILPNTEIGDNSIIAAGSVVKGKFEPNSIIAGVPAKKILNIEEYYEKNLDKFSFFRSDANKINLIKKKFSTE